MTGAEPDGYVVERIRTALALDPRLHELGIHVEVDSGTVLLSGDVPTGERREAVGDVAREVAPGYEVRNEVGVLHVGEVDDVENIS